MTAGIGAADAAIYTGICVEDVDPAGQGRIKYQVPQLSGTAGFGWASPVSPGVTSAGDYVYIAFEGGDRNRPLYWPDQPIPFPPPTPPQYQMQFFSGSAVTNSGGAVVLNTGASFTVLTAHVMYDQTTRSEGPYCSGIYYDVTAGHIGTQWMNGSSVINTGTVFYRGMAFG